MALDALSTIKSCYDYAKLLYEYGSSVKNAPQERATYLQQVIATVSSLEPLERQIQDLQDGRKPIPEAFRSIIKPRVKFIANPNSSDEAIEAKHHYFRFWRNKGPKGQPASKGAKKGSYVEDGTYEPSGILLQLHEHLENLGKKLKPGSGPTNLGDRLLWFWKDPGVTDTIKRINNLRSQIENLRDNKRDEREDETNAVSKNLLKEFQDFKNDQQARNREDDKQKILEWLSPLQSLERQDTIRKDTFPADEWLLNSYEFKAWLKGPSWYLWCYGEPGAGKTVLASQVTQHLRETTEHRQTLVLALFFDFKETALQSVENLLGSLLKQAIQQQAGGIHSQKLNRIFQDSRRETSPHRQDLLEILKEEFDRRTRVYLVLDGWEGISPKFRSEFDKVIGNLSGDGSRVSTLIFSRTSEDDSTTKIVQCRACGKTNLKIYYYCKICAEMEFCEADIAKGYSCGRPGHKMITEDQVYMHVKPQDSQIRSYVQWEMGRAMTDPTSRRINYRKGTKALSTTPLDRTLDDKPSLKKLISDVIVKKSRGNFQSAKLYIASIKLMPTAKDIEESLKDLPEGLPEIYMTMMKRFSELKPSGKAKKLIMSLYWIAKSQQPLTFPALQHAIAIEPSTTEIDDGNLISEQGLVLDSSGVVIVGNDTTVRMHLTMHEWLDKNSGEWFAGQESQMALRLLTYLNFEEFRQPCASDSEFDNRLTKMPLLEYASQHWAEHVAPCCADPNVKAELLKFLTRQGNIESCLQVAYEASSKLFIDFDIRKGANGLHLAAFYGWEDVVVNLIQDEGIDVNSTDPKYGQTALMYAARNGYVKVVETLLGNGAKVDVWSFRGGHTLFDAYLHNHNGEQAHVEITKILLRQSDSNVNLRYEGEANKTLLMLASYYGNDDLVRYILAHHPDVDVNAQDKRGYTALALAVEQEQQAVVELLLKDSRVRVDLRQEQGETALELAVKTKKGKLVDLLLADRSEIFENSDEVSSALFKAVEQGKSSMVSALLDRKLSVKCLDKRGRTLLHAAAFQGNENIMQLLLDFDLDKNARASDGATALHEASREGNLGAVKTLLKAEADKNLEDNFSRIPLVVARQNAWKTTHYRIMSELDSSAAPDQKPLEQIVSHVASLPTWSLAHIGLFDHVQARLASKSQWNLMDRCPDTGNSALHFAALHPRKKLLEVLLQANFDQSALNFKKQNPLHIAIERGDLLTVELLLRYPPYPLEAEDEYRRRPLKLAHERGYFAIAVALVEVGAVLDSRDRTYIDPTFLEAVKLGKAQVAETLIRHGADHLRTGQDGVSARQIAKANEDVEMLRVLDRNKSFFVAAVPMRNGALCEDESGGDEEREEVEEWATPPASPVEVKFHRPEMSKPMFVARPH